MIGFENLDNSILALGESRHFTLVGDGPFRLVRKCFVDHPRPPGPGFIDCDECAGEPVTVETHQEIRVSCSKETWDGVAGFLELDISSAKKENMSIVFPVNGI